MLEHGRANGKSALELKELREGMAKERITQRMKYGSKISAVMKEEDARRAQMEQKQMAALQESQQLNTQQVDELQHTTELLAAAEQANQELQDQLQVFSLR